MEHASLVSEDSRLKTKSERQGFSREGPVVSRTETLVGAVAGMFPARGNGGCRFSESKTVSAGWLC
jgi:phosphate/sulfate permease